MRRTSLVLAIAAGAPCGITLAQDAPASAQPVVRYDGHRSVRVTARTNRELMTVLALTDDVLTCGGTGIGTFDVRLSPEQFAAFTQAGIPHQVLIPDLQAHIDAWRADNERIRNSDGPGWYDTFRNLDEIQTRLSDLAAAAPAISTISVIGQSLETRDIRMIRITGPGSTVNRPAIVINGTQHSRESLTPMTTMWLVEQLLTRYGLDPRITTLVDGIDWHIVPVFNPDGYTHVWNADPMWRKNRRVNTGSSCMGVDLNRNWSYQWGLNSGSSPDPCSETYRGTAGFSEPETQAISGLTNSLGNQNRLKAYVDVHSYATKILSTWGYTLAAPPDIHRLNFLGVLMRNAISAHRGTTYIYGAGSAILYLVSGGSKDYVYGTYGAAAWTIELPGTSFHPPAAEILPVARETELGFLTLAEHFLPVTTNGACCVIGGCIVVRPSECTATGGVYLGDNSACSCPTFLKTGNQNAGLAAPGGIFLDLTATGSNLTVPRIDYYSNAAAGTPVSVELWTYPGSYVGHDNSSVGWVLHDTITGVNSTGTTTITTLNLNNPLTLVSGQTVGVYLIGRAGGVRYTNSGAFTTWADANLTLFSSRARSMPWAGNVSQPRAFAGTIHYTVAACYPNCDASTLAPVLNIQDFSCFLNRFAAGDTYANCDASTAPPTLNVQDFTCFLNSFAAGCT